jgi:glycosyltransferase involved in cell wall biosynthesis
MRIGYLSSHYPAVAHTFVLREIHALRRLGVEVEPFSIHRAPTQELLSSADYEEARRTYAALPVGPLALATAHLRAFMRSPRRYTSTLAFAVRRTSPGLRQRLWGLFYFGEAMLVWQAARRRRVRHLHAVFADVASDVALLVVRFGGEGWSWSLAIHGPVEFYDITMNGLAEKVENARFSVAISDFGRSQLMALASEDRWKDIHVVRCGIDPDLFADGGGPSGSEAGHILCVGRLVHLKGQALLIEAVAELVRRGRPARLTLVGDGPKRGHLEELSRALGIADRVTFTGAVGQDRIQALYRSADVFCLPSMAEGLPVVLMEAMALQIPVVATQIMSIPELVEDGRTGLLVAPGRVDTLVEALDRLMTDSSLRERLAREGQRKVLAEFDVNVSASRLRDVLTSTFAQRS